MSEKTTEIALRFNNVTRYHTFYMIHINLHLPFYYLSNGGSCNNKSLY